MSKQVAVETIGLTKLYGFAFGLREANLKVYDGEIFGLFGPNGSGKTTLIKLIGALVVPTKGIVRVYGSDVVKDRGDVKKMIGMLTHHSLLYDDLTVRENLTFYLNGYERASEIEVAERVEKAARFVEIEDRLDDLARTLSEGLRRRADIARSIIHDPKLLLLDEAFAGLDMKNVETLKRFLMKNRGKRTVILSSHSFEIIKEVCDRIAIMRDGMIIEVVKAKDFTRDRVEKVFA